MKWDVLNKEGSKVREIDLPDALFDVDMNESLVHGVMVSYRANTRQGTHATKTRSLVSGGGKKPFRQKGTGGARRGSSRSPLLPGGGTAHGPQPRDYRQKINKKVKGQTLRMMLTDKVKHQALIVLEDLNVNEFKTKNIVGMLDKLGLAGKKVLLTDETNSLELVRSSRNIHKVNAAQASEINTYDLLATETLVLSEQALAHLQTRLGGGE